MKPFNLLLTVLSSQFFLSTAFAQTQKEITAQADSLDSLGIAFLQKTNYEQAMKIFTQALKMKETIKDSVRIADSYNNVGVVYYSKGNYDNALKCYKKALDIRLKVLGPDDQDVARSYNNVGTMYASKGDYDQALAYLKKSLKVISNTLGPEHPDVASLYANMGAICVSKNDYECAIEYYKNSLDIWLKVPGPSNPNVAATYNNIGEVYSRKGNFDRALEYHKKALETRIKTLGTGHPSVATSYNNIAAIFYSKGDYDHSLEYLKKSLETRIKTLGPEHPNVAASYNNIAAIYGSKTDYDTAAEYYKKGLEIWLKALTPEHPNVAASYYNIGNMFASKGDYDTALEYHKKSLEIRLKALGSEDPDVAISYQNVGNLYYLKGDYDTALQYINSGIESMKIYPLPEIPLEKSFLRSLPITIRLLYLKSKVLLADTDNIDNNKKALQYLTSADELLTRFYKELTITSPKLQWTPEFYDICRLAVSAIVKFPERDSISEKDAFRWAEQAHARMLTEQLEKSVTSLENLVPQELLSRAEYYKNQTAQIEENFEDELDKLPPEERHTAALKLYLQVWNYDSSLTRWTNSLEQKYPLYAHFKYPQPVGLEDVQKILAKDEALLAYDVLNDKTVAWVIYRDKFFFVTLPVTDSIITSMSDSLRNAALSKKYASLLYNRLFKPLEEHLNKNRVLYIIPDGSLRLIPFEMLYDESSNEYLLTRYKIAYLQSASTLVLLRSIKRGKAFRQKLIAFGNPVYGVLAPEKEPTEMTVAQEDTRLLRGLYAEKGLDFKQIPMTGQEVFSIAKALSLKSSNPPEINLSLDANENAVKTLNPDSRYIHFACTGYLGNIKDKNLQPALVLSLVNNKDEDGFLKMSEIFNLKLNTDLVTLSACRIGTGKESKGEGILGLTGAFMCAGASSIVLNLWSVPDSSAVLLMSYFYKNLESGKSKVDALQDAKLQLLKDYGYNAPFILLGEVK